MDMYGGTNRWLSRLAGPHSSTVHLSLPDEWFLGLAVVVSQRGLVLLSGPSESVFANIRTH